MATKRKYPKQAPRAGAGRPKVLPLDAKPRWYRVTPAEDARIRELIREMRAHLANQPIVPQ